jgi:hypothetical protein
VAAALHFSRNRLEIENLLTSGHFNVFLQSAHDVSILSSLSELLDRSTRHTFPGLFKIYSFSFRSDIIDGPFELYYFIIKPLNYTLCQFINYIENLIGEISCKGPLASKILNTFSSSSSKLTGKNSFFLYPV